MAGTIDTAAEKFLSTQDSASQDTLRQYPKLIKMQVAAVSTDADGDPVAQMTHPQDDPSNPRPFWPLRGTAAVNDWLWVFLIEGNGLVLGDVGGGASGGITGVVVQDDGVQEGASVVTLNFGTGLDVAVAGNVAEITAPGGAAGLENPVTYIDYTSQASAPVAPAADTMRLYGLELTGNFVVPEVRTEDGNRWRLHRDKWQNAYNNTGSTITAGTVVKNNGNFANGFEIQPAKADAAGTMPAWGVVVADIANGARGWVMLAGHTAAIVNTSGMTIGDPVYVSPTTAGAITNVRPSTPGHYVQPIGFVTTVGTSGVIFMSGDMYHEMVPQGWNMLKTTADVTSSGTVGTFVDVTGLSFPMVAGKTYMVKVLIGYTVSATTTAAELSWSGPAMTQKGAREYVSLTTTSQQVQYFENADSAAIGATSGLSGTGINIASMEGMFIPSASGTFTVRIASDVASGVVVKAGSVMEWTST